MKRWIEWQAAPFIWASIAFVLIVLLVMWESNSCLCQW